MGKDRSNNRGSKYNPSSSGEASSLLQGGGFIGFSAFTTNFTNATDPDYYQVEPEYQVLLKKLQKKDSISRIKGLEELNKLFMKINIESAEFDVSSIKPLMNAWDFMYRRLVNDDDRHVRDLANICLGSIGSRIGKHMGPHVKSLLGPWLFSMCDQKDQNNNSALNSFNNIFPEKKQKDVYKFGHDEALTYLCENLQETPQTIGDSKSVTPEVLQDRYERCISNSLLAIECLINKTQDDSTLQSPSSSSSSSSNTTTTTTTTTTSTTTTTTSSTNKNIEIYENIFESQFFSFFSSKSSLIRKSSYRVLVTIINKLPMFVEKNFKEFSSKVLGLFSEKDSTTHLFMWDAIITFLKSYGERAWGQVDVRKHVLPRLWSFFKSGCYGSYDLSYPSILPLLTFIPSSVVGEGTAFFKEFFGNLFKGLEVLDNVRLYGNPNSQDRPSNLMLKCYMECLVYSSKKWGSQQEQVNQYLIQDLFGSFYRDYFNLEYCPYTEKFLTTKLLETTRKLSTINEQVNVPQLEELFKLNVLNDVFINLIKAEKENQNKSPSETKEEKLVQLISNETFFNRLNLFLSYSNISSGGNPSSSLVFINEFIKRLFNLSCGSLSTHQEYAIKMIDIILKNYKIDQILLLSNDFENFISNTIIPSLNQAIDQENQTLISNLISITLTLLSSKFNQFNQFTIIWSNILNIFINDRSGLINGSKKLNLQIELSNLINNITKEINNNNSNNDNSSSSSSNSNSNNNNSDSSIGRSKLLSNSLLDKLVKSIISNCMDNDETINKQDQELISALLFNMKKEYEPVISSDTIELLIKCLLSKLKELMGTIEMNLLLDFNINYLVELSLMILSINNNNNNNNNSSSSNNNQESIKNLINEWIRFIIEIHHRPNLNTLYSKDLSIINQKIINNKYLNNSSTTPASIINIIIEYVYKSSSEPDLQFLSNQIIQLINNNQNNNNNNNYLDIIFNQINNNNNNSSSLINQIKISWFRYNNILPLYLITDKQPSQQHQQEINQLFKIIVFNFNLIGLIGFEQVIKYLTTSKSSSALIINQLLSYFIFINNDNKLIIKNEKKLNFKPSSSSSSSPSEQELPIYYQQVMNFIDYKSTSFINEFIKSLFKYYEHQSIFSSEWFNQLIIGATNSQQQQQQEQIINLLVIKLFIDYLTKGEYESDQVKKLIQDLLNEIKIEENYKKVNFTIQQLNLIQVLLPILPRELIQYYKDTIYNERLVNLSTSIPNDFTPVVIQLSLISSIILQEQINSNKQVSELVSEKEFSILLNTLQVIQQWYQKLKSPLLKDSIENNKELELVLLNFIFIIIQYSINKQIYVSTNQSQLIQSLLSVWLTNTFYNKDSTLNNNNNNDQLNQLINYQSLKIYNLIITKDNIKYIIPASEQFIIDHSILVLNNWLELTSGSSVLSASSINNSYLLELYSNTFEKMSNDIKYKISLTRIDNIISLLYSTNRGIQKTAYSLLESYFTNESSQLVKSFLLSDNPEDDDDDKVQFIVFSKEFERILLDYDSSWKELKKNKSSSTINIKCVGQLMLWNLLLKNYSKLDLSKRSVINGWLNQNQKVSQLLNLIFNFTKKDEQPNYNYSEFPFNDIDEKIIINKDNSGDDNDNGDNNNNNNNNYNYSIIQLLCSHCIFSLVNYLPNMFRRWVDDCSTNSKMNQQIQNYVIRYISPIIIQNEITRVNSFSDGKDSNFTVKGSTSTKEVIASYEKDDITISLVLSIPDTYPLRVLTVEFSKRVGVSESQWRQWLLSMTSLLLTQDGSVLDACLLWKNSLDKHFEGVEVCPICYSMFHNGTIPKFQCKTCRNKFHAGCIYKWFQTSHKSNCPLCNTLIES